MTNDVQNNAESLVGASKKDDAQTAVRSKRNVIAEGFRNRTKGERLFNRITYTGVAFFGVTSISVLMTWILRDNPKTSAKYEAFVKKVCERFPKHEPAINSNATIATLFTGGTIVSVLPIKWLEDNKARLVKKFDHWFYGKEIAEKDPDIVAAHKEMEALPQQTWGSVFSSRLIAFAATLGTALVMGSNESPLARATGESIDRRSTQFGRWMDKTLNKNNPAIVKQIEEITAANKAMTDKGIEILREAPHVDRVATRIWSYIGLDGFYSIITSVTLYAFTRILAPIIGKKSKEEALTTQQVKDAPTTLPVAAEPKHTATHTEHAPTHHVSQTTHHQRLAEPTHAQEVTA